MRPNSMLAKTMRWLKKVIFYPRPSCFAVLLRKKLMGETVYASGESIREGAHVFVYSCANGKDGKAYWVINNSRTKTTTVELPSESEIYVLTDNSKLRNHTVLLNGHKLALRENDELAEMNGV